MGKHLSPEPESWISPLDRDMINLGFIFILFSALLLVFPLAKLNQKSEGKRDLKR